MYVLKGGNNLANEQSVFRFDLNESLYFEKGQEVEEIMGISLDPEISIQEFTDYISIRGVVELQGSYQKLELFDEEDEADSYFESYDSRRYMERVTDTSYGSAEFMHRFPVEITVPSYRVENLNDVLVTISEFDYELPEPNHLNLRSTIEIHGINNRVEEVEDEDPESVVEESEEELIESRDAGNTFEFDVKPELESSSFEEPVGIEEDVKNDLDDEMESDRWKFKKESQTFEQFFNKNKVPEVEVLEESSSIKESSSSSSSKMESHESREEKTDLTYLSDIFRSSEEEYFKLKLCIVQDRDTLESIAEKYETSTLQIRNYNQLEEDDVTEGQLLYIPIKK
ncbi:MAG TPA: stage VI sporulation protein D [Ornithinibacillus sp.]|nr:stage VI sporulation protein D [Ornithinibacillus sp.]